MPVVAAAVVGAGASIYGASQAKKASNKAADAQAQASAAQLAAQREALDKITALNQPFVTGGNQAFQALLNQFGITSSGQPAAARAPAAQLSYDATGNLVRAPAAAPAATPGMPAKTGIAGTSPAEPTTAPAAAQVQPGPDYAAYLAQNPDIAAEAARVVSTSPNAIGDVNADGKIDAMDYSQYHAQTFHDRAVPTSQPQTQAPSQIQEDPNAPPDLTTAGRPQAAAAQTFEAPDMASYFSDFEADPGAAYRRSQALDGVNAASAVRGKLRSGDAAKALATVSSDLASQEYNNWFNRQNTLYNNARGAFQNDRAYDTSMWQYGVDRGDQNFNTDRGYQTTQNNTGTGNLFDLAKLGLGAAGNVSGAVTNNANNASSIYGSQAQAATDAANARANANSGLAGSLAGTASNLFANWGGSTGSTTPKLTGNWAQGTW